MYKFVIKRNPSKGHQYSYELYQDEGGDWIPIAIKNRDYSTKEEAAIAAKAEIAEIRGLNKGSEAVHEEIVHPMN
jgi:hypothetical protein